MFKELQAKRQAKDETFKPLNIACVFSPPAESYEDVQQIQEDLPQEKADNQTEPEKKKEALKQIIGDYNQQYGTNHSVGEFDLYYQDIQGRIKDQKYPNTDYPHKNKIDIIIVVDMLLTGFDSKYLNTLYVDKNLKYHGLIQAFSRTNRVLNDTKPYGNILDFRHQEKAVDDAIALFSGKHKARAKEIWLVDPAPEVINKLETAVDKLAQFMNSQGLSNTPEDVNNLKGDKARAEFITHFKEIQRLKTQLDQYTDIKPEEQDKIEAIIPQDDLRAFRSMYLETAQQLKALQDKDADEDSPVQELDFEFVLFSSAVIDYDYIMSLIAKYTQGKPSKEKMTREQLIDLLSSSSNLMQEKDDIIAFINNLKTGDSLNEQEIRRGYETFKAAKSQQELRATAEKHGLAPEALHTFVNGIRNRMIFDGEQLTDLLAPLELGWKDRRLKEIELMEDLVPLLKKLAEGREISGLAAYE